MVISLVLTDRPKIRVESESSAPVSVAEIQQAAVNPGHVEPSVRRQQSAVLDKLRLQSAMRSAKELLAEQRFSEAIDLLEPCLDHTAAPAELLSLLEQCYRGRIAELVSQGASREASLVAERLRAMASENSQAARGMENQLLPTQPSNVDDQASTTPPSALAGFHKPVQAASKLGKQMVDSMKSMIPRAKQPEAIQVRAKLDDAEELVSSSPVDRADALFKEKKYGEALIVYEQAATDPQANMKPHEVRWGYCLLAVTIARYNEILDGSWETLDAGVWEELKSDAQRAYELAPRIKYCQKVIDALDERVRDAKSRPASAPRTDTTPENTQAYGLASARIVEPREVASASLSPVQHREGAGQWQVAETRNFVIYHRDREIAEVIASQAEQARKYAIELWFLDDPASDWQPKCELYLYPTSHEYSMATGVPAESPGHSKVLNQQGQIQSRQVFLRMDDPNARLAVLPHEVAHVVFAGRFGASTVPRWADEGMAVLTEPMDKQNAHLANLARCYAQGAGFSCAQVMTMGEYPPGERMRDFYAHSVGICRNIVEKHGHAKLIAFLRLALQTGNYESALQQVLGMESFRELEGEFRQFVGNIGGTTPVSFRR
jgi:tetratricopeptide (TPR) repeat protein